MDPRDRSPGGALAYTLRVDRFGNVEHVGRRAAEAIGWPSHGLVDGNLTVAMDPEATALALDVLNGHRRAATLRCTSEIGEVRTVVFSAIDGTDFAGLVTDVTDLARSGLESRPLSLSRSGEHPVVGARNAGPRTGDVRVTGALLVDRTHADDRPAAVQAVAQASVDGSARVTSRWYGETGSVAVVDWLLETHGDGEVIATGRDVTEHATARDTAERESRAKSQMLANMSHELRTPLNAIIGYSELLLDDVATDELRSDLGRIRDAGLHLLSVVNGVLDLAKIESGQVEVQIEEFHVSDLVEAVAGIIRPMTQRNGNTLRLEARTSAVMETDRGKLQQLLLNLLSNAAKFTRDGTVTLRVVPISGDQLQFDVEDTGAGMTAEELSQLFVPFAQGAQRAHGDYSGTGLGACLAARFARILGGELTAVSTPGKGTRITLTLPTRWSEPSLSSPIIERPATPPR